jgi:1-deoxy-D-xylulose-5-phosphate synthase
MIPNTKTPLLDRVEVPADMRAFDREQLKQLADELRAETIEAFSLRWVELGVGIVFLEVCFSML